MAAWNPLPFHDLRCLPRPPQRCRIPVRDPPAADPASCFTTARRHFIVAAGGHLMREGADVGGTRQPPISSIRAVALRWERRSMVGRQMDSGGDGRVTCAAAVVL